MRISVGRTLKKIIQAYLQQIMTSIAEEDDNQPTKTIEEVPEQSALLSGGSENEVAMQVALRDLIKHHFGRKQRTLEVPANNGRNFLLIQRPYSKDVPSFIQESQRSNWILQMLVSVPNSLGTCPGRLVGCNQSVAA
jgi:hypothetical protein